MALKAIISVIMAFSTLASGSEMCSQMFNGPVSLEEKNQNTLKMAEEANRTLDELVNIMRAAQDSNDIPVEAAVLMHKLAEMKIGELHEDKIHESQIVLIPFIPAIFNVFEARLGAPRLEVKGFSAATNNNVPTQRPLNQTRSIGFLPSKSEVSGTHEYFLIWEFESGTVQVYQKRVVPMRKAGFLSNQ